MHGDLHAGNILIRDQEVSLWILMIVLMHRLFVIFDAAVGQPTEQKQLNEIFEGYEIFRGFEFKQLALIPYLQTLRILQQPVWLVALARSSLSKTPIILNSLAIGSNYKVLLKSNYFYYSKKSEAHTSLFLFN